MSEIALSTRGLCKSFGSLVVASDIELTLPAGARYALIGPNGAGKTTLINLMTGMLRPDSGRIVLDGADITALPPEQRVKRGLVRTFQINALFPHLTALESVTLAVCERTRAVRTWGRKVSTYRHEIDEAYDILAALSLTAACHRPTRELAYGQQRLLEIALAMATRPKCCCSTNRPRACRARTAPNYSRRSPACRATSRCCSSSTTWSLCFASPRV